MLLPVLVGTSFFWKAKSLLKIFEALEFQGFAAVCPHITCTMSKSDSPKFVDTIGIEASEHVEDDFVKERDDPAVTSKEEIPRANADVNMVSTETKLPAGVDQPFQVSESQQDSEMAENNNAARRSPPIPDENRYMQERHPYLEDEVVRQCGEELGDMQPLGKEAVNAEVEELELRKHIRQAASAEKLVRKAERQAEKTARQRQSYGQGPNNVSPSDLKGEAGSPCTMYHIRDDGTIFKGTQFHAVFDEGNWKNRDRDSEFHSKNDVILRNLQGPDPYRGIRPPTALRPIYGAMDAHKDKHRFRLREDARTSKKLGPPTQWDESDSEEWSSETSTRSQDFNYFRARLRGDFEWELDRLNAQVARFKRHKAKKQARQLALKAEEDGLTEPEVLGPGSRCQDSIEDLDEVVRPKLNIVDWRMFQVAKAVPTKLASVIDILTEDPKLGNEAWSHLKRSKKFSKNYKAAKTVSAGHMTFTNRKAENEVDSGVSPYQSDQSTGQNPLPERIRINSRIIIEALSDVHGTPICEASTRSLVILRPFKILSAYEKEIRGLSSQVAIDADGIQDDQVPPENGTMPATASAIQKPIETSPITAVPDQSASDHIDANQLRDIRQREGHLNCLQHFMDHYIDKKVAYLNGLDCSKIAFLDLWYLFRPGTTVISADGKQSYQVVSVKSKPHKGNDRRLPSWATFQFADPESSDSSVSSGPGNEYHDITIKCVYIHFDGHKFGPVFKVFGIDSWEGVKDIAFLDVYPLRLYVLNGLRERTITSSKNTEIIEEDVVHSIQNLQHHLIDRGKKFVEVAAVKHMYYSGLAVNTRDEIESQVVIDFEAAFSDDARRHWRPRITRLLGTDWNSKTKSHAEKCEAECCLGEDVLDDSYIDINNSQNFVNNLMSKIEHTSHKLPSAILFPRPLDENRSQSEDFTEEELMIMSFSVFGFVLRDRTWGKGSLSLFSSLHISMW